MTKTLAKIFMTVLFVTLILGLLTLKTALGDWWQECAAEREQFCREAPSGGGQVANCIDQHMSELSPRCKSARPGGSRNAPQGVNPPAPSRGAGSSDSGRNLYQTNFQVEIDPTLRLQQPTPGSMTLAISPCQPSIQSLRVFIRKDEDYSRIANGAPRAEINFGGKVNFQIGKEYRISWSTCLPPDFQFDSKQPEGISQIHEGTPKGSPPWGLNLVGGRYHVLVRDGARTQTQDIGSATADLGSWVHWTLHYRPDPNGINAITELEKDGASVASFNGVANAFPNDNRAYLKIGIYKWWWQSRPSDATERIMYFGDVSISEK
jgi:hypothetical protein